jgi:hypothetical protein
MNLPDQFILASVVDKEFAQTGNQFIVRAPAIQGDIAINALSSQVVSHAFGVAVIPGAEIAVYKG